MAKIALITDTHFGVRNDNQIFAAYQARFYEEVFFPYLDAHGIKIVRHLGDIVDRRKYVNYLTSRNLRRNFIDPCMDRGIDLGCIIGNHDTFYKNTNEVNSMNELYHYNRYDTLQWWEKPVEEVIDGCKILIMPWICTDNWEESMAIMEATDATVMFGHLEIAGFEMYRGNASEHGWGTKIFDKFDIVCSGHYHHKSTRGNINYLGAPYEMTWSDFDDERGFHVFDTETRELEYIVNPLKMFHKLVYNDQDKTMADILAMDLDPYKDTFLKLVVQEKTNPYWFDMLVEKIEKLGVADLKIIEDSLQLDLDDDELINEAEDTLTILRKYAATYLSEKDADTLRDLNVLLTTLYNEAQQMETLV
jgi:UDP-2,3-diacylglucosamine pyrophosphatase LpxH